jgi:hypothetical protein
LAFNLDPYLSATRSVIIYAGGIATTLGLASVGGVDIDTAKSGFDHILNGVKEIGVGVGILAPAGAAVWGMLTARLSSKVAKVQQAAPADLATAVAKVEPAVLAKATAAVPGVEKVVIKSSAGNGLAAAAADPAQPKITKEANS